MCLVLDEWHLGRILLCKISTWTLLILWIALEFPVLGRAHIQGDGLNRQIRVSVVCICECGLTAFVLSAFFCCNCIVTWDCVPDKYSSFSETGRGQRWGLRNKCSMRSTGYRIKFSPYASQVRVDLLSRGNWEWSKDRKSDIYIQPKLQSGLPCVLLCLEKDF